MMMLSRVLYFLVVLLSVACVTVVAAEVEPRPSVAVGAASVSDGGKTVAAAAGSAFGRLFAAAARALQGLLSSPHSNSTVPHNSTDAKGTSQATITTKPHVAQPNDVNVDSVAETANEGKGVGRETGNEQPQQRVQSEGNKETEQVQVTASNHFDMSNTNHPNRNETKGEGTSNQEGSVTQSPPSPETNVETPTADATPGNSNTMNEDSTATTITTTNNPPNTNTDQQPNTNGDADSSSISSVWVRVPLLVVVALSCILV